MLTALALTFSLHAQARHVDLTWTASSSAGQVSVSYNMYRTAGACPGATFAKINTTPIGTLTYSDTTISIGSYCYYATTAAAGLESVPSNKAQADVVPLPPSGLTAISPVAVTINPGGSQQFTALAGITPLPPNSVTWTISPLEGAINNTGLYRAPPSIQGNNHKVRVVASDPVTNAVADITIRKGGGGNALTSLFRRIF